MYNGYPYYHNGPPPPEATPQHPPQPYQHPGQPYMYPPPPQAYYPPQPGYPAYQQYPQAPYYPPYPPQQPQAYPHDQSTLAPPPPPAHAKIAPAAPAAAPAGPNTAAPPQQHAVAPRFKATTDLGSAKYHTRPFMGDPGQNVTVMRHRMWVPKSVQDYDESAAVIASVGICENGDKVNFYHIDGAQMRSLPLKNVHSLDMHRGILALAANEEIKIVDVASGRVLRDGVQPNGITSAWDHVAILGSGKCDRNPIARFRFTDFPQRGES